MAGVSQGGSLAEPSEREVSSANVYPSDQRRGRNCRAGHDGTAEYLAGRLCYHGDRGVRHRGLHLRRQPERDRAGQLGRPEDRGRRADQGFQRDRQRS